jgi:hypothetical protein
MALLVNSVSSTRISRGERLRTILRRVPVLRDGELAVKPALGLGLIVDRVEADDALEEDVELGMGRRVGGDFVQGLKDVCAARRSSATTAPKHGGAHALLTTS